MRMNLLSPGQQGVDDQTCYLGQEIEGTPRSLLPSQSCDPGGKIQEALCDRYPLLSTQDIRGFVLLYGGREIRSSTLVRK